MTVSIIIPIYNVAPYIERCLKSVIDQTYQNIEIILVNDCTPDNSMEIVQKVIDGFSREYEIKICNHNVNQGLSSARNTGFEESKGDYVYFLDSDDDIAPTAIENLLKLSQKYNSDFVLGDFNVIGLVSPPKYLLFSQIEDLSSNRHILEAYFNRQWYCMACNKLIKRDFLKKNSLSFKEGIYHEDELWSFQLALKATKMSILYEKTYNYYIRHNSITAALKKKNIEDLVYICDIITKEIRDKKIFELIPESLNFMEYLKSGLLSRILNCEVLDYSIDRNVWLNIYHQINRNKLPLWYYFNKKVDSKTRIKAFLSYFPDNIIYYTFRKVNK